MTTTHTHKVISKYFSSLRHAQVLGGLLIGSVLIMGTSFAQLTVDTTLSNSIIAIQKIFLSANGLQTGNNSSIDLNGLNGNVRFDGSGKLSHVDYSSCANPPCILKVDANGEVILDTVNPAIATTNNNGESYWTRQSSGVVDTGAYDINFGDPTIVYGLAPNGDNKQDQLKVRIGIASGGTATTNTQLYVKQGIETREGLVINYPLGGANTTQLNAGAAGGTRSELTTNATDGDRALTIKSHYRGPSQTTSSFIHFQSGTGVVPTRVGINTPSGEYPTRALDNNGETLMRDDLNVGYNSPTNPVTTIRQSVGPISLTQNPANYNMKSCATLPAPVSCTAGGCSSTTFVGIDVGTHYCYNNNGSAYDMYVVFTTNNYNTLTVDTINQRIGVNTLSPQDTLDVVGNTTFGQETKIMGLGATNGMTNVKLAEVDSTESTPYNLPNMCCKVLSVDANSNITLVDLPSAVCTPAPSCPIAQETYQYSGGRNPGAALMRCGCDTNIHVYDSACDSTGATYLGNVATNGSLNCYDVSADTNTKKQHTIQMINYVAGGNSTLQHQVGTNAISTLYTGAPKCSCDTSDGSDCNNPTFTSSDVGSTCIDRQGVTIGSYIPWGLNGQVLANNFDRL